jgi:putative peptide zinc metalloprotease protein
MTITATERRIEQVFERERTPGGLWSALARHADEPALGVGDMWRGLERRLLTSDAPPTPTGLWAALAARADPAQYRPHAIPDVAEEQVVEDGQSFTVIRSPRGNYLRLTAPQRELWRQMDGQRTVANLATQAFVTFKQLLPVGELVTTLKQEGFLVDQPIGVYRGLGQATEARTAEGWGRRVLRALAGRTWQIKNIDQIYGTIYRAFGWLFFTPVFVALWSVVALAGLAAFILLLLGARQDQDQLFAAGGSAPLQLAALWLALLISFLLHESAHALAVKHFGRELRGGGAMLYFGTPAFFVDTSDIWRSPSRARMLVSAAGPMSDLFVGALAALLVLLKPDLAINTVAYKLAFTCYIATLFNANPLLELDGYFILVDWLRLPDLRRRALAFIRGPLWKNAKANMQNAKLEWQKSDKRSILHSAFGILHSYSREERIFTLYGALTLLYSIVAIWFAIQFWSRQLDRTIGKLWQAGGPLQRVIAAALFLLIVVPVLVGLFFVALSVGRAALAWVIRRGYGRQPALLAAIAGALAIVCVWAATAGGPAVGRWLPPILWGIALGALLAVRPDYRRAAVAPTINALLLTTALAALAAFGRALLPAPIWTAADGLAFVFLLVAGFAALLDVDLRLSPPRELLSTALLLMLAFAVGGLALFFATRAWPSAGPVVYIVAGAPAYFGALAVALLLPHLFGLHDSRLIWSWGLFWLAALVETAAYIAGISGPAVALDTLAAALWAAAWLVHLATLRQIAPDEIAWPHEPSISETQRLTRAFQFCYAGCYRLLRAVYGARRAQALDDRMDVLAATANWDVTLDRDRARIAPTVQALSLDLQGARYAEVLRYAVGTIEEIAGASFARRAIRAAYDALPWPERETASRLCFPDTPWARELSNSFGDARAARLRLLRQVDLFLNCDDDELAALAHGIQEQDAAPGTQLLLAGASSPGMWIVEAGEVVAWRGGQEQDELHRGEAFGARELLENKPADLSYRANVASSLLFIPAAELESLMQERAPHAAEGLDAAATLRLLERVPLFADMPRNTLRGLAHVAQQRRFDARAVIVRQGQPSGMFYIIKQGRAAVLARSEPKGEAAPKLRPVAQLGPEEFFGELELLRGTPPVASVVAVTTLVALALPHAAIQALLMGDGGIARGLEQVGTGRLIALRQGANGTA